MLSVAGNGALLVKALKALSDELSLTMLRALVDGPATASELARRFQCKQWTAWRHLEELCQAGLIKKLNRAGKTGRALYVALKDRIQAVFDAAMSYTGIAQGNTV